MTENKYIDVVSIRMVKEPSQIYLKQRITNSRSAYEIVKNYFDGLDREHLVVMCLNTQLEPVCINTVAIGSLSNSVAHPREIFKTAILSNAGSIVLFHNHPSGCTRPSNTDLNITGIVINGGMLLGIELLDHIIVGDGYTSMRECTNAWEQEERELIKR